MNLEVALQPLCRRIQRQWGGRDEEEVSRTGAVISWLLTAWLVHFASTRPSLLLNPGVLLCFGLLPLSGVGEWFGYRWQRSVQFLLAVVLLGMIWRSAPNHGWGWLRLLFTIWCAWTIGKETWGLLRPDPRRSAIAFLLRRKEPPTVQTLLPQVEGVVASLASAERRHSEVWQSSNAEITLEVDGTRIVLRGAGRLQEELPERTIQRILTRSHGEEATLALAEHRSTLLLEETVRGKRDPDYGDKLADVIISILHSVLQDGSLHETVVDFGSGERAISYA